MNSKPLLPLFRKGYVERGMIKTGDGLVRYAYKLTPNI